MTSKDMSSTTPYSEAELINRIKHFNFDTTRLRLRTNEVALNQWRIKISAALDHIKNEDDNECINLNTVTKWVGRVNIAFMHSSRKEKRRRLIGGCCYRTFIHFGPNEPKSKKTIINFMSDRPIATCTGTAIALLEYFIRVTELPRITRGSISKPRYPKYEHPKYGFAQAVGALGDNFIATLPLKALAEFSPRNKTGGCTIVDQTPLSDLWITYRIFRKLPKPGTHYESKALDTMPWVHEIANRFASQITVDFEQDGSLTVSPGECICFGLRDYNGDTNVIDLKGQTIGELLNHS